MAETPELLKRMIVSAINAREVENARISRLLHDEVGQVLSAVGLHMDVLKLDFKAAVPDIVYRVNEIQKVLDTAVQQVRALSYDLNPSLVERAGLQSALDRLIGRYRSKFGGSLRFSYDPAVRPAPETGSICYKIAELALDNSVRHAKAENIEVTVRASARSSAMEIRDNGCGFERDAAAQSPGLGLLLIEHYAAQAPVSVDLQSSPGQGTLVRVQWNRTARPSGKRNRAESADANAI